ncbi:Metastasis suppressor protein 1 [Bagarius yarrelli]|uniref:Metastasis suppressor protein 1 n=1 Tax=Bagarius yarrelli TaxID=175774 RepID=A0A556V863_BAGYA|nr:Metastasis suppressor protein 1 [Bagarius yarrelli]
MDAVMEKECSALGGLFQSIMNDMKASYPVWEDFVTKGAKLQSQLKTTIIVVGSFLDAFQKVADIATGTRGATKEIGSALTRMCMRHRSIENKLKLFTTAFMDNLISPLEMMLEEWKKVASQLDKDHAKGKDEVRIQLDSALQDVNTRYTELEETEKRAVCRALIEERGRFCSFVTMLKPVLDEEMSVLGEVTHLQSILEDLCNLTVEPSTLPPASEQVILDLKGSDYTYTFQTPPASPSNTLSRKSSISSNYASVRHVPSLDSISSVMESLQVQEEQSRNAPGTANGTSMPPPRHVYSGYGERARAQSTSGKPKTAREQLALTMASALNSETPHTSRDSLHCSSGYSTQTTTPSCSEDTIPSQHDYDYISLHGGDDTQSSSDFDKSCTIPRNSELSLNYRKLFQSKRPASTVSLLSEPESLLLHQPHTATIRRKPSSKASLRRGTISGGVPIAISTPQVPLKPSKSTAGLAPDCSGIEEGVCIQVPSQAGRFSSSDLAHTKPAHCTTTRNINAATTPYYSMFPGQPPTGIMDPINQISKQEQRQFQHYADNQQYNQNQYHQHYNKQEHPVQHQQHYNKQEHPVQHQQHTKHPQHYNKQEHPVQHPQHYNKQEHPVQHPQHYNKQEHPVQHPQHYNPAAQETQNQQQYTQAQYQRTHHYNKQQQQRAQHIPAQHPQFPFQQHPNQQHDQHHQKQQKCQLPQQNAALQCWSSAAAPDTSSHSQNMNDPSQMLSGGNDMLSMIRRGVKLRRTLTNDRSAPLITTNYLN